MRLFSLLVFLFGVNVAAKPIIVVAVIDTGFTKTSDAVPLCKIGRLDFTKSGVSTDSHPQRHGSNVIGLIAKAAKYNTGYCIVSLKIFKYENDKILFDPEAYLAALEYIAKLKPSILNLSMAGQLEVPGETYLIKNILKNGTQVVAAAGNDGIDLNYIGCVIYPACADPKVYMVGNSTSRTSNYGSFVDIAVDGTNKTAAGVTLTGTSQAAAIFTGNVVRKALELR